MHTHQPNKVEADFRRDHRCQRELSASDLLVLTGEVEQALIARGAVVGLETTLIAHGLPFPQNLSLARELEQIVRDGGAVPATIGVLGGFAHIGLTDAQLEHMATSSSVPKLGARDLGIALAQGLDGATTVSGTISLAAKAGLEVVATGGIGGVHLGAVDTWDESADMLSLSATRVAVVASGVKSILDIRATVERLETLSVPIIGYKTRQLPGFFVRETDVRLEWSVEDIPTLAAAVRNHFALSSGGLLIAHPVSSQAELPRALHRDLLEGGLAAGKAEGISGKQLTPFLLDYLHTHSNGATIATNTALVKGNAALAAALACELAAPTAHR